MAADVERALVYLRVDVAAHVARALAYLRVATYVRVMCHTCIRGISMCDY